jgi:hypothetical protein
VRQALALARPSIRKGADYFPGLAVNQRTLAKSASQFGRQHSVQLMMIMGEYFGAGCMLNAIDQRRLDVESAAGLFDLPQSRLQ